MIRSRLLLQPPASWARRARSTAPRTAAAAAAAAATSSGHATPPIAAAEPLLPSVDVRVRRAGAGAAAASVPPSEAVTVASNLSRLKISLVPRWSEDYELLEVTGDIHVDMQGSTLGGGAESGAGGRKLRLAITVPDDCDSDGNNAASVTLAVPQRSNLTRMGSPDGIVHDIAIAGGESGRLEGDMRIIIPRGNIFVHKARGECVELRTAAGRVDVKSVLEGLTTDVSCTDGFASKRVMGENVTVRVSGGNMDLDTDADDHLMRGSIEIGAVYGGHYFLQSRRGSGAVDTAQVKVLDVRAGGAPGVEVGGMSGVLLAHASAAAPWGSSTRRFDHVASTVSPSGVASNNDSAHFDGDSEDDRPNINVCFDQVGGSGSGNGNDFVWGRQGASSGGGDGGGDGDVDPVFNTALPGQAAGERSVLRCEGGGSIRIGLSDHTPIDLDIALRSGNKDGRVLLPDNVHGGAYTPGRQTKAGLQMGLEAPPVTIFEGKQEDDRVEGWLRSAPRPKNRAGEYGGGSGKIRTDGGAALAAAASAGGEAVHSRPHLSAFCDSNICVEVSGWMDRIKRKHGMA